MESIDNSTKNFECCNKCNAIIDANNDIFCPYCGTVLNNLNNNIIDVKPYLQQQRFEKELKELIRKQEFSRKMRKRIIFVMIFYIGLGIGFLIVAWKLII